MGRNSDIVNAILFDYEDMCAQELAEAARSLDRKLIRWVASIHVDNYIRKILLRMTDISIGHGAVVNRNFIVSDDYRPLLHIGARVAIGPNVTVICSSNPNNSFLSEIKYVKENLIESKEVMIRDDVWIGSGVVILPGVTIGPRTVIAAGTVVAEDIPQNVIAAGVPCRVVRLLE